jgi:hypothetical protein
MVERWSHEDDPDDSYHVESAEQGLLLWGTSVAIQRDIYVLEIELGPTVAFVNDHLFVFFGILVVCVPVGFGLAAWLYSRLERDHPDKYRDMGEPTLFANRSVRTNLALLKFVFRREDLALNDPVLSRLTVLMLCFVVGYNALFLFVWFTARV